MRGGSNLLVGSLVAACVTLAGCGGPALLKEPQPREESSKPVTEGKDERILAAIDTVIVRNGAGAWASDALWDEYQIRIRSLSDEPVEITGIAIFDALDHRIEPRSDRSELVAGARETERRYEQSGKLARGDGGNGWVASAPVLSGGWDILAGEVPPVGLVLVLAGAGVVRMVNNAQVSSEIERRATTLPVAVPRGSTASIDLFFPATPLSGRTQVVYVDRHGEHRLDIETRQALARQDPQPPTLVSRVDPEFPDQARRARIDTGHVKARLTLDRKGLVRRVDVIESVPLGVFDQEARLTFRWWKYDEGRFDGRMVEATLEFKR